MGYFEGKRVLVTGGAGFIGSHLCRRLTELGAEVKSFDVAKAGTADVRRFGAVHFTMFQHPDIVFHLAAQTEVLRSYTDPMETYSTNVTGTLNVLEACRLAKVETVVIASSDKAFGWHREPCREDSPLLANADPYSSSKRLADELTREYVRLFDLPAVVVRCCNVYGPGQRNKTTLITGTVDRILNGFRPVVHAGHGGASREWLYVDDAVEAYLLLASSPESRGKAWNVGSGERRTVARVVGEIQRLLGQQDDYEEEPTAGHPASDQGVDAARFRAAFPEWEPLRFEHGLRLTVEWYKETRGKTP